MPNPNNHEQDFFDGMPVPDEEFFGDEEETNWDGTFEEDIPHEAEPELPELEDEPPFGPEATQLTEESDEGGSDTTKPKKKKKKAAGKKSQAKAEDDEPTMINVPDEEGAKKHKLILLELQTLFDKLNEKLFHGELGKPIIDIQCGKRGPKKSCWCSTVPAWRHTEVEEPEYYHISFSGECMDRPPMELVTDLLHQMVHIYNAQAHLKDTSRAGTYHNHTFRNTAEKHGLLCDAGENKKDGFANIMLPAPLEKYINSILTDGVFTLTHKEPEEKPKPKKKKTPTPFDDFNAAMKDIIPNKDAATSADIAKVAARLIKEILRAAPENERRDIVEDSAGVLNKHIEMDNDEDDIPMFSFMGRGNSASPDMPAGSIGETYQEHSASFGYVNESNVDDDDFSAPMQSGSVNQSHGSPAPELAGLRKYVCPCCQSTVYGPAGLFLSCGVCDILYEDETTLQKTEKMKMQKDLFVPALPNKISPQSSIYQVVARDSALGRVMKTLNIRTLSDAAMASAEQIGDELTVEGEDTKVAVSATGDLSRFLKANCIHPMHSSWAQFG